MKYENKKKQNKNWNETYKRNTKKFCRQNPKKNSMKEAGCPCKKNDKK